MVNKARGNLYAAIGVSIFGVNFVSMKYLLGYLPPFAITFSRFFIATIFLYALLKNKSFDSLKPKTVLWKDQVQFMISGVLGVGIYYIFQTLALVHLTASLTALICALIPLFTLLTNVIIFRKPLKWFSILAFIIALSGVYMVLNTPLGDLRESSELQGIFYMFFAIFSWIAYTFKTYTLQRKFTSLYLLYKQCLFGTVFLFFFALYDLPEFIAPFNEAELILPLTLNLLFVGVICSAIGYYYYVQGMNLVGVEVASLYMNLMPVVTTVVSFFILKEAITPKTVFGMLLVLAALYSISLKDLWTAKKDASFKRRQLQS